MFNARVIYMDSLKAAEKEIIKTGSSLGGLPFMIPKAVHMVIKLEGVSSYAANIIKQEMLSKGGDAAVHKGVVSASIDKSDILLMGTYGQYQRLVQKLDMQSGTLKSIAAEIQDILDVTEKGKSKVFRCRNYSLPIGSKTYVMGILNVTPDSFSDGGKYNNIDIAVDKAKAMVEEGADIIDIGGESTRPGYDPVDAGEEAGRVVPVVERLVKEINVPVSIDTMKAEVAEKALEAGAHIINDVWGLQRDHNMAETVARFNAGVIMMHNQDSKEYQDLMGDMVKFFRRSIETAQEAGISREYMCIDPGIGFGKTYEHNLEAMRRLKELNALGLPVLLGTSRKSFIGNALGLPVDQRVEGTAASVALGIANGVDFIRVHDVKEMARVSKMTDAMVRKREG